MAGSAATILTGATSGATLSRDVFLEVKEAFAALKQAVAESEYP